MTKNSAHDIMSLPSQPRPIFVAREEEWHHRKLKAKIANEGRRRRKKKVDMRMVEEAVTEHVTTALIPVLSSFC